MSKSATTKVTTEAIVDAKGDLDQAATTLGISLDALRARIRRGPINVERLMRSKASAHTDSARKVTGTGPVVVKDGQSGVVTVDESHPAAVALILTHALGGSSDVSPTGLRLYDAVGHRFAIVTTRKASADFYVTRVPLNVAKDVAEDLDGNWDWCFPRKEIGCATLRHVTSVNKKMMKALMHLAAKHGVDRRRKGQES